MPRSKENDSKQKEMKNELWSVIMNIIKTNLLFILIVSLTGCSIYPWKTIKFNSITIQKSDEIMNKNMTDNNVIDSEHVIGNVLFYFVSNGIEDTMYNTEGPYSLNFVFESFEKDTIVKINSIELIFDEKKENILDNTFPIYIKIDFPGYPNKDLYLGNFKTPYVYNLEQVNEISVQVNVSVNDNGTEVTKTLRAKAKKEVKKGILQYRY